MKRAVYLLILFITVSCERTEMRETYYEDGTLRRKEEIRNGKRHGIFQEYSPDGKLFRSGRRKDEVVEEMIYYHESGKIKQVQHYDEVGMIVAAEKYMENGKRDSAAFVFLYINETDTLKKDENGFLKARMLNTIDRIHDEGKLFITSEFDTTRFDDLQLSDTLATVYPDSQKNYLYKLNTKLIGEHIVYGQFIFTRIVGSKMQVATHHFQYPYFITE
jgi:hypothetical protein